MLRGCRSDKWDKQHGVDVERARLMKHTREVVAKGQQQQAEHVWHTASHVQHVTAMLQVTSPPPLRSCLPLCNLSLTRLVLTQAMDQIPIRVKLPCGVYP